MKPGACCGTPNRRSRSATFSKPKPVHYVSASTSDSRWLSGWRPKFRPVSNPHLLPAVPRPHAAISAISGALGMPEYRLGDVIDDYCVKCKQIMNHSVVSLVDGEPAKVRCRTC